MEKSRNLGLVGASTTEWQLITPRGGLARPPPAWYRVKLWKTIIYATLKNVITENCKIMTFIKTN